MPSKKSRNEDGRTERGRFGASHVDASPRGCARLRQREERRLRLEPAVPADAGALELLRFLLGEQVEVGRARPRATIGRARAYEVSAAHTLPCLIARVKRPCAVP